MHREDIITFSTALAFCALHSACEAPESSSTLPTVHLTQSDPLSADVPNEARFVAIERAARSDQATEQPNPTFRRRGAPGSIQAANDFLIGIHKSQLNRRYFLSGFLESSSPELPPIGLGTRVVSFKLQNSKLFILSSDDRGVTSSDFQTPEIIDALPVTQSYRGVPMSLVAPGYVVFDPDRALNGLELISNPLAIQAGSLTPDPEPFQIFMSYSRDFQSLGDGFSFKKVLSGQGSLSNHAGTPGDVSVPMSATVAVTLRDYRESSGFVRTPLPQTPHYFASLPHAIPDTGGLTQQFVKRWHLFPGMKPIHWEVSPWLRTMSQQPGWENFEPMRAIARAFDSWNQAIGFEALTVGWSQEPGAFGRDDRNFLLFDRAISSKDSYAHIRSNPNTGEIRGASIMISGGWMSLNEVAATQTLTPISHQPLFALRWHEASADPLCSLRRPELSMPDESDETQSPEMASIEQFLTYLVAHELGHALGLRHNFKASISPMPTSVMDYLTMRDIQRISDQLPLPYDVQAIRYLTGQAPTLPDGPFCSDPQLWTDPDCSGFDEGENPVEYMIDFFLNVALPSALASPGTWTNETLYAFHGASQGLLRYLRSDNPEYSMRATQALLASIGVPVSPEISTDPALAWVADQGMTELLTRLYDPSRLADIVAEVDPLFHHPRVALVSNLLAQQAQAIVENRDSIRSPASRRRAVAILRKMQSNQGRLGLVQALMTVRTQLALLETDQEQRMELEDLVVQIEQAMSPYFEVDKAQIEPQHTQ